MKYANVSGVKLEAKKGLIGICQGCEQPMIPVCGDKREWHWRHKVDCKCDHWWENETEWHRAWKNHFPNECQEIRHKDESTGEWHIVDVKTEQGHFLEFQHSLLKKEEREARNKFYGENLIWIVNGLARKNDWPKMERLLNTSKQVYQNTPLFLLPKVIEGVSLLSEWGECKVPVLFDFGGNRNLCCLLPKSSKGNLYVVPFSRHDFILLHKGGLVGGKKFSELITFLNMRVFAFENPEAMAAMQKISTHVQAPVRAQVTPRTVYRQSLPMLRMSDLNYILKPQKPISRRGRRL